MWRNINEAAVKMYLSSNPSKMTYWCVWWCNNYAMQVLDFSSDVVLMAAAFPQGTFLVLVLPWQPTANVLPWYQTKCLGFSLIRLTWHQLDLKLSTYIRAHCAWLGDTVHSKPIGLSHNCCWTAYMYSIDSFQHQVHCYLTARIPARLQTRTNHFTRLTISKPCNVIQANQWQHLFNTILFWPFHLWFCKILQKASVQYRFKQQSSKCTLHSWHMLCIYCISALLTSSIICKFAFTALCFSN